MSLDDQLPASATEQKKIIRSALISKYTTLIILVFFAGYVSLSSGTGGHNEGGVAAEYSRIAREVLSGAVAALLLSFVYDVFTKMQEDARRKLDTDLMLRRLSRQVFISDGILSLPVPDLSILAKKLIADERFLEVVAAATAERRGFGAEAMRGLLGPIWRGTVGELYSWENRLVKHPTDPSKYIWRSKQKAALRPDNGRFRLALTDSAMIEANLLSSEMDFDSVIVLEKHDEALVKSYLQRSNLSVKLDYHIEGKRQTHHLTAKLRENDKLSLPETIVREQYSSISVIEFDYPADSKGTLNGQIEWECSTPLSYKTPFCYVQADAICFVRDLIIDYREIKDEIKNVWAISFVGTSGATVNHDEEQGRIVCQIDGALMPGQGIVVVWKEK